MDQRLQVDDPRRPGVSDALAGVPLMTIAWRILREQHKRLSEKQMRQSAERDQLLETLAAFGEQVYRLRRQAEAGLSESGDSGEPRDWAGDLARLVDRLQDLLGAADIALLAPEGEPYDSELMNLLENTAQLPDERIVRPQVAEVISPTLLYRGGLLKRGKAVIAIPARPNATGSAGQTTEEEERQHGTPNTPAPGDGIDTA